MYHREPTSRTQHPRRFGEILGRKDADYEIDSTVLHRPFGPQIRNGKREHRPPPCSLSRRLFGNIEANTKNGRCEGLRRKMMPRARTGIQDAPLPEDRLHIALQKILWDRRYDVIEMACGEEFRPMPQLLRAIAARSWLTFSAAQ